MFLHNLTPIALTLLVLPQALPDSTNQAQMPSASLELIDFPERLLADCQSKSARRTTKRLKDHNKERITQHCYKTPSYTLWVIESANPNLLVEAAIMKKDPGNLPRGLSFDSSRHRVLEIFGQPTTSMADFIEYVDPESGYVRSVALYFRNNQVTKIVWSFEID